MEDLIKQMQSQLKERAASPLLSAFVISWALWNYRFLVILFSDATISQTFHLIDQQPISSLWSGLLYGLLYPALTTSIYIFAYPYPAKYVYEFTSRRQKELRELKQQVEDQTPLTLEESRAIRGAAYRIEVEGEERVVRKDEEIKRLKEEIKRLELLQQQQPQQKQLKEPNKILPKESSILIKELAESSKPMTESKLLSLMGDQKHVVTEYNLGELELRGFISKNYDGEVEDYCYALTHQGRNYYVNNILSDSSS